MAPAVVTAHSPYRWSQQQHKNQLINDAVDGVGDHSRIPQLLSIVAACTQLLQREDAGPDSVSKNNKDLDTCCDALIATIQAHPLPGLNSVLLHGLLFRCLPVVCSFPTDSACDDLAVAGQCCIPPGLYARCAVRMRWHGLLFQALATVDHMEPVVNALISQHHALSGGLLYAAAHAVGNASWESHAQRAVKCICHFPVHVQDVVALLPVDRQETIGRTALGLARLLLLMPHTAAQALRCLALVLDEVLLLSETATCAAHATTLVGVQAYINLVLDKANSHTGMEVWRLRTRLSLVLTAVDSFNAAAVDIGSTCTGVTSTSRREAALPPPLTKDFDRTATMLWDVLTQPMHATNDSSGHAYPPPAASVHEALTPALVNAAWWTASAALTDVGSLVQAAAGSLLGCVPGLWRPARDLSLGALPLTATWATYLSASVASLHALAAVPTDMQAQLPALGWTHWLLAQSPTRALLACALHNVPATRDSWQCIWTHSQSQPAMICVVQRALLRGSNTSVEDKGGPEGPAFLAGPSAGDRLLAHTLPLALLAPTPTLHHLVRVAVNGQHGALVAALLRELVPLWGGDGLPADAAVLGAVEAAVREGATLLQASDAAGRQLVAFLSKCMEDTCPLLPASTLLHGLVLPSIHAALQLGHSPALSLPLAMRLAAAAVSSTTPSTCWLVLHAATAVLARRPWQDQKQPLPLGIVEPAREAVNAVLQVLQAQDTIGAIMDDGMPISNMHAVPVAAFAAQLWLLAPRALVPGTMRPTLLAEHAPPSLAGMADAARCAADVAVAILNGKPGHHVAAGVALIVNHTIPITQLTSAAADLLLLLLSDPTAPNACAAITALGTRLEWWLDLPGPSPPGGALTPNAAYVADVHTLTLALMLAAAPEKARWTALCDALSTLLPWVDGHEARLLAPALVLLLHLWACWGGGFAAAPTRECVSEGCADQWEVTTVGLNTAADEALLAAVGAAVEVLVAGVKGLADAAGVRVRGMAQAIAALGGVWDVIEAHSQEGESVFKRLAAYRCFAGACAAAGAHGVGHTAALQALLLRLLLCITSSAHAGGDQAVHHVTAWVMRTVTSVPSDMQRVLLGVVSPTQL